MECRTYSHLFFDLDNTLTRSRSKITLEMRRTLEELPQTIGVISGASVEQIAFQLDGFDCTVMGENGNTVVEHSVTLWRDTLTDEEKAVIFAHIDSIPRTWFVPDEADLIEDRGAQVSFSIYGHHAPVPDKEKADADRTLRTRLLAEHPLVSDTIEVRIAGTTCLDYFRKGRNKGYNIARYIEQKDWHKDDCLYFGDMLMPGGNDESVIGVIDTREISNPEDTLVRLQALSMSHAI